jgi:hypothetical protein
LAYVAEQYAVTLDQLAVLIGRSYRTARGLRDRWVDAGWAGSARLAVDLPPFVWLTSRGTTIAGNRLRTWQPSHGLVYHVEAVTNVRLVLDRQLRLGRWECERSIAQRSRSDWRLRAHLPDAILQTPERVAIEVELTLKSRSRLEQIVTDLSLEYDQVWYFARGRLHRVLSELAAANPIGNVTVYTYPPSAAEIAVVERRSG